MSTPLLYLAITLSLSSLIAHSASAQTAEGAQKPFAQIDPENLDYGLELPEWTDAQIRARFRMIRDLRFLTMDCSSGILPNCDPQFERRIPWLFTDTGCETRAYHALQLLEQAGVQDLPLKIFVFATPATWQNAPEDRGELHAISENHNNFQTQNYTPWDYHVAPIVKSSTSGIIYVLDPAIYPDSPLPWLFWVHSMTDDLNNVNITFGRPQAYDRGSEILGPEPSGIAANAQAEMAERLVLEYVLQVGGKGHSPTDIFGDEPPWFNEVFYPVWWYPYYISACDTCSSSSEALTPRCIEDCP